MRREDVEALLAERSIPVPETGCWIWTGAWSSHGYGHFVTRQKHVKAHRASLEMKLGVKLRPDQFACHSCDTPQCVNPEHLFLGTHTDNMMDMDSKMRRVTPPRHGAMNGNAKLSEDQVMEILRDPRGPAEVAEEYGVQRNAVIKIRNGRAWSKVTGIKFGQRVRLVPEAGQGVGGG